MLKDVSNNKQETKNYQSIKPTIMRTLNNNQITQKLSATKTFAWNAKRRFK